MHQEHDGLIKYSSLVTDEPLCKDVLEAKPLDDGRYIKYKLICNRSYEKPELFFCNKVHLKNKNSILVQRIIELKELEGKEIKYDDFNFDSEGYLERNKNDRKRIDRILNLYGASFEKKKYIKASSHGRLSDIGSKLPGDTLRIFVETKNDFWNIVLIDPWHHVATENYKTTYKQFKKKYVYNIEDL